MKAIWYREMYQYFLTPIGYIFIGIFLIMSGSFFAAFNIQGNTSDLDTLFGNLIYLFMIISPLLTMRLLGEERKNKTDQLLLTSPLSIGSIVVGKYFAAISVFAISLLFTAPLIIIIAVYATPYWGVIFSNYIGFFLMGSCYLAIGEWMSALTENQISAAVSTYAIMILLQVFESVGASLSGTQQSFIVSMLARCSLYDRYYSFTQGIFSFANVFFYLSIDAVILFAASLSIAKRK